MAIESNKNKKTDYPANADDFPTKSKPSWLVPVGAAAAAVLLIGCTAFGFYLGNANQAEDENTSTSAFRNPSRPGSQSEGSSQPYIGGDSALAVACAHAGVSPSEASQIETELDRENSRMIYEVNFCTDEAEYEYDIDALTGEVLKNKTEFFAVSPNSAPSSVPSASPSPIPSANTADSVPSASPAPSASTVPVPVPSTTGNQPESSSAPSSSPSAASQPSPEVSQPPVSTPSMIGEDAAQSAALAYAGVSSNDVKYIHCWIDYDNGRPEHYEVEFAVRDVKYECSTDLYTGEILKFEKENDPSSTPSAPQETPASNSPSQALIGESAAQTAALKDAGASASTAYYIKCELEHHNGNPECYKVEFTADGIEHEYEIDVYTGAILKHEHEYEPGHHEEHHTPVSASPSPAAEVSLIGETEAQNAAFAHAGVSAGDVYDLKVKFDREDGVSIYEVEFKSGGWEYEYEVDAANGTIIKSEKDRD